MIQPEAQNIEGKFALTQVMQDEAVLMVLRQENPTRYRSLHEQALAYLNVQIKAGAEVAEVDWTAIFDRLAYLYVVNDSTALVQLLTQTAQIPLQTKAAQHTRQFFQGMAFVRQDLYADALQTFDDLLHEVDIPLALKARTINARAVIYRINGRFEEAIAGYQASLALWRQLDDHHYQGISHLNLGIIAYTLRDYTIADNHYRQAITFFTSAGSRSWLTTVQNELGLVKRDLGQWDEALACFEQIIARRGRDEADEDVGMGYANMGEVLLFKGEIVGAKTALNEALKRMVSRTYRIDHLLYLGLALQAEGNPTEALAHFEAALELAQTLGRREALPAVYYHLGDIARQQEKSEKALSYWQQAANLIEETHTPLRDESLKISLLGRWQQVYEALILHCVTLGRIAAAFTWAERARARAFGEGLEHDGERPFATIAISLSDLQAAIPEAMTLLCYFTTGVLEQDIPLLRAIPTDNPLRAHILTPAETLLFVITNREISLHECPLDPNLFATSSPRGFDATRFLKTAVLQRLSSALLPPLSDSHFPDTNHFVIMPHGPLHRVPFTAVLAQTNNPATLSFAPSGTIFAQQKSMNAEAQRTAVSCVAIGYNAQNLKYTHAEAMLVADLMGGEALLGSDAKTAQLRERAATCRWLHIACHGWFDDTDPLASYLETGEGERLTAQEVLETWSLTTELVTLSACETGVSQILRGDEPMGLVRAFLYAGAQSVLVSQWPVDDLATFLLMMRFYQELQAAPAHLSVALAQAQEWLREVTAVTIQQIAQKHGLLDVPDEWRAETKPFAAPQFWAGFVIVGNLQG